MLTNSKKTRENTVYFFVVKENRQTSSLFFSWEAMSVSTEKLFFSIYPLNTSKSLRKKNGQRKVFGGAPDLDFDHLSGQGGG